VHQKYYLWARVWSQIGSLKTTESYLDKALAVKADYPAALHLKGLVHISRRHEDPSRITDGLKSLSAAREYEPRNPRILLSLSLAHEFSHQPAESIRFASQAVSLSPDDPLLWSNLADLLQRHHALNEAAQAYRKALALIPSDPRLLNNLAFTLLELGQESGAALTLARESVRLLPNAAFNLDTLAWAYHKNGMHAEALETIREARTLASGSLEIDFHFGVIAMACGVLANPISFFTELGSRPELALDTQLQHRLVDVLASLTSTIASPSTGPFPKSETRPATETPRLTHGPASSATSASPLEPIAASSTSASATVAAPSDIPSTAPQSLPESSSP
ncbi:MAG TPA: hypothetical protein PKO06_22190, partial [Candidatus Ozemobacteraceae bacterium]|nr:hypothetical protein [Candidatus Ozemobacteraceae bacterium]